MSCSSHFLSLNLGNRSPEMDTVRLKPPKRLGGFCAVTEAKLDHKQLLAQVPAITGQHSNLVLLALLFEVLCDGAEKQLGLSLEFLYFFWSH